MIKRAPDVVSRIFLTLLAAAAILYVALGWTPSSYGAALQLFGAPEQGPILGTARPVRSDEWAVTTALIQASVRNHFQRFNHTSFYGEDLRNAWFVPLQDWSLAFKPHFWGFFVFDPAHAMSFYFGFLMAAMLAGYHLLFREMGADGWLAAAGSLVIFFSGFTQFETAWLLAGAPWVLFVLIRPMAVWKKAVALGYVLTGTVLAFPYPALLLVFAVTAVAITIALRREWFRSRREFGQITAAVLAAAAAFMALWLYLGPEISVMKNTVYPGQRISPPGTVAVLVAAAQLLPFLPMTLSQFGNLVGENIVEIGAIGSFLPLLTLCLIRFREAARDRELRWQLAWLLGGAMLMTLWELAPLPSWVGRITFFNNVPPQRALFGTGLLLTTACILIWIKGLVEVRWKRLAVFAAVAPVLGTALKMTIFSVPLSECHWDLALAILLVVGTAAAPFEISSAKPVLLGTLAAVNVFAFGRFNPVQPATPIFQTPDTAVIARLREKAEATGGLLIEPGFPGAILNGVGFRSVAHVLAGPELAFFRRYFPGMDPVYFHLVFNRFAHVTVTEDPLPNAPQNDVIRVPAEVFRPIRNVRHAESRAGEVSCVLPDGGMLENLRSDGPDTVIAGWAPWKSESAEQGIRVFGVRPIRILLMETVSRPDVAGQLSDYNFVKAGFRLRVEGSVGLADVSLIAFGTPAGEVRLGGSGCKIGK